MIENQSTSLLKSYYFEIRPIKLVIQPANFHIHDKQTTFIFSLLKMGKQEESQSYTSNRYLQEDKQIYLFQFCNLKFEHEYVQEKSMKQYIELRIQKMQRKGKTKLGSILIMPNHYILSFNDQAISHFNESAKISDSNQYELQFQAFIEKTPWELQSLIRQLKNQSTVKTPITKRSKIQQYDSEQLSGDDQYQFFPEIQKSLNLDNCRLTESQIFESEVNFIRIDTTEQKINKKLNFDEIQNTPRANSGFKIELCQVEQTKAKAQFIQNRRSKGCKMLDSYTLGVFPDHYYSGSLSWRQLIAMTGYCLISALMIYYSMQPVKRI